MVRRPGSSYSSYLSKNRLPTPPAASAKPTRQNVVPSRVSPRSSRVSSSDFRRSPVRLRGCGEGLQNGVGPPAHSRLAGDEVDGSAVGGYECRPPARVAFLCHYLVDQPVQRPIATVADEMTDPRTESLDDPGQVADRISFVHLAPRADETAQVLAVLAGPPTILAREGLTMTPRYMPRSPTEDITREVLFDRQGISRGRSIGPLSGPLACLIATSGAKYILPEVPTGVVVAGR